MTAAAATTAIAATVVSPDVDRDPDAARRSVTRSMAIGAWVWPAFTLLDAWMCFVAYPDAPFGLFVAYRVGVLAVFYAVYRGSLRPDADIRRLFYLRNITYGLTALVLVWNWWSARRSETEAQSAARRRNELASENRT